MKPIKYNWQWQLKSAAADLWPYVADTQRFNQATRLPAIEFNEVPLETGGSQRLAKTNKWGIWVAYEDFPFEWVKDREFSNLRIFEKGPISRTYARLRLEPNKAGTLLRYYVEVTPANLLGLVGTPYQFGWEMKRNFGQIFLQIDDFLQQRIAQPFMIKVKPLGSAEQKRLTQLTRQLTTEGHIAQWVDALAELLTHQPEMELTRIQPYYWADRWQAPRRVILELFLSAAKIGLLDLRWDIMCPLCRGAKFSASSLDEMRKGVHCPTCNIDFEGDFSKNVELTFTPNPQIRTVYDSSYCIGGPMVTPHILIHQTLEPGETRSLMAGLKPGGYRLRTQRPGVEEWLDLGDKELLQLDVTLAEESILATPKCNEALPRDDNKKPDPGKRTATLIITNRSAQNQRLYVEQSEWYHNAVTAAEVTTLQHFRDLFSDEVLRPGEEIGVQGVTILFSDLVGSTAMYNRRGDAPSYALVRKQFAFLQRIVRLYDGAIVKTIGDAIMAAFSDPARGVQAALAIQDEIRAFNAEQPEAPLMIKLGLHTGPCIAVNLNGRLDYFGTTVNLAARLEGQSRGGDVVISARLCRDPEVARLLASHLVSVEPFESELKGFDEHLSLYRLTPRK